MTSDQVSTFHLQPSNLSPSAFKPLKLNRHRMTNMPSELPSDVPSAVPSAIPSDHMHTALTELIAMVIDVDPSMISTSTVRADVDTWDSLAQLGVIAAVEETYGVVLSTADMQNCNSVAAISAVLASHGVEA
jgi:acyl carrier protein